MTRHALPSPAARRPHRSLLGVVVGVLVALLLTGCGQTVGQSAHNPVAAGRDRADVTFARTMMAGNGQAQMMERWAADRSSSRSVQAMSRRMMRSQSGWDRALRACVTRWRVSSPQGMMGSQGGNG